ncbi:metallophosphoesterase [Persephonella sp.]
MSKKSKIIQEYIKDTTQSYRQVYEKLKNKIDITYNYTKRILSEYNKKQRQNAGQSLQNAEKTAVTKTQNDKNGTLHILKRKKRVLFVSDIHVPFHDATAVRKAFEYGLDEHVNTVVLGGDIMDNMAVSFWKNRNRIDFLTELELMRNFLNEVRGTFVNSNIYYVWGNHEQRHEKYLLSHADKLFGLEEISLENLLKLSEFRIRKIDNRDYMQQHRKPFQIGKLYYLHGHEIRASWGVVNIARNLYLKAQDNIIFGHFHQSQEFIQKDINGDVRGSWAVGCLCEMSPDYSIINNWNHGFAVIEYEDDGDFTVYNRKIINGKVV